LKLSELHLLAKNKINIFKTTTPNKENLNGVYDKYYNILNNKKNVLSLQVRNS